MKGCATYKSCPSYLPEGVVMKRIILGVGLVLVLALGAAACGSDDESSDSEAVDIVDTAVAAGSFETLASLLESAGLVDTLKGEGPYTVFAPTDDAFAKLPQETLDSLGRAGDRDPAGRQRDDRDRRRWDGHGQRRDGDPAGRRGVERRHPRDRHRPHPRVALT
jgi:hypothetical protein